MSTSDKENTGEMSYGDLVRAAKSLEEQGNARVAAKHYLKATLEAPSKWTENRWNCLLQYTRLAEVKTNMTLEDVKSLKKLTKDESEPILFRAHSLLLRGNYDMSQEDDESAAIYYGRALHLIPKATSSERRRQVNILVQGQTMRVSVGDQLDALRENNLTPKLEFLEDPARVDKDTLQSVPKVNGRPDPAIVRRLVVGGGQCDACGKSRLHVRECFQRCDRCKRAYYCSRECQQRQWHAGHKKACRPPGQIKRGDYMMLRGIQAKRELNGKLVKVTGDADAGNRWAVTMVGKTNPLSIAPEKLVHIRPAK